MELENKDLVENESVPLLKQPKVKKPRPPLTDKQKESMAIGRAKLQEGNSLKRAEKLIKAAELIASKKTKPPTPPEPPEPPCAPCAVAILDKPAEPILEESEDEIIYMKAKAKPKPKEVAAKPKEVAVKKPKKTRKVIIYEESSSDEDDADSPEQNDYHYPKPIAPPTPDNRNMKTQQNRKTVIKQQNEMQVNRNFFCD
jgi:hypothetical protein